MKRFILLLVIIVFNLKMGLAQVGNNMCEGALPFCTGTAYSFPAGTGTPSAQSGPFYSCLGTTPNPAWYYMKIALPGMIQITMHSEPSHDIDFCLWGPFDNQNACGQLTSNKVVDCSYSTASTEVVDIPNAIQGKYYILIITNYSNQPCNIIFSQTGGAGSTDCTILPPAAGNDGPLCVGETLHLAAANMNNAVYHWAGPDGWSSVIQNPTRPNVQLSMAGIYSLSVTVNGQPSADTNYTSVAVFNKPTASLAGGAAICQGDSTQLTITCQNHPPWVATVTANGLNPQTIPIAESPFTFYVHPLVTTTYAITAISNQICSGVASGTAVVDVNPKPVSDFTFSNNCSGSATLFSDASTIPSGFVSAWHWDFGVFVDTSNIQNPTFTYPNGGTYNVLLRVTSNNGCKGQIIKPVLINPTPVVDAGIDKTIPYGTNTTLQCSVTGGTGNFSYHWEPANLLVNANIPNPSTVNLSSTTDFYLTVTDLGNSCQQTDVMTVTITGGPMGVQLIADPQALCLGASSAINAQSGGGSGVYSYSWTSNPPGFTSTLEDITVQPDVTTTYSVEVTDGFSTLTKNITITVYPTPVVSAGSDITIPNGTTTTLSGSASGGEAPYLYSWSPSNLVAFPTLNFTPTLLLTNTTTFTLTAIDSHGCTSSGNILVSIIGGALQVTPQAEQSPVCIGESTALHPLSTGGSGNYTYTWSVGGNVVSNASDPVVSPTTTTTYHLAITDGFTQSIGDVTVLVNPLPVIHLIPAGAHAISGDTILACVFDTLTISALNPNSTYLWTNGATTPEITSATTGLAFDMLTYAVNVTNSLTGCSNSASLTVLYTYSECSYGVPENDEVSSILVYPNPGNGLYTCRMRVNQTELKEEVINLQGIIIRRAQIEIPYRTTRTFSIDLTDQPSGVYFLRLFSSDFFRVVRIIKL